MDTIGDFEYDLRRIVLREVGGKTRASPLG